MNPWDQLIIHEPRKAKPTPVERGARTEFYLLILAVIVLLMFIDGGR